MDEKTQETALLLVDTNDENDHKMCTNRILLRGNMTLCGVTKRDNNEGQYEFPRNFCDV